MRFTHEYDLTRRRSGRFATTAPFLCATGLTLVFAAPYAHARDANDIIVEANHAAYYAGQDARAEVRMVIRDASGSERVREFTILRLNTQGEDQKFYVYFQSPADVRRMAYLVWKHVGPDREDDRWLWLPALNLVRRIAPGDKRTSFVGSDFIYEDVSGRGIDADTHTLIAETDALYQIRAVPKKPGEVEFSEYTIWIDKTNRIPVKAEYLDAQGQLYRRVSATRIEEIQGYPTVVESMAEDLKTGSRTINTFSQIVYNIGLKEDIFTERFLRRPPRVVRL